MTDADGARGGEATRAGAVPPDIQERIDCWHDVPAFVHDERLTVVAANPLARALCAGFAPGTNLARYAFLDPDGRNTVSACRGVSGQIVAVLRSTIRAHRGDIDFSDLVGELALGSEVFSAAWAGDAPAVVGRGVITLKHPLVGPITLRYRQRAVPGRAGLALVIWRATADETSSRSLHRLIDAGSPPAGSSR